MWINGDREGRDGSLGDERGFAASGQSVSECGVHSHV